MKILLCSEFFCPSVGGVQEVVKQLGVRFVKAGHDVEIATSFIQERELDCYEGIKINSFHISGNYSNGLVGDVDSYRLFLLNGDFDLVFIYAAQQWTLDCLIGFLDKIKAKKVLVPCGFSGLYLQQYRTYFDLMPEILGQFDQLIFHSTNYRDYKFAREKLNVSMEVIANAADNNEFNNCKIGFRDKYKLAKDDFILLTVGSLTGSKGHLEVAKAFSLLKANMSLVLILNGNRVGGKATFNRSKFLVGIVNNLNFKALKKTVRSLLNGMKDFFNIERSYFSNLNRLIIEINRGWYGKNKRVVLCDLNRADLISCYFESNLFVFASNIEYSPLVLFEACAAGLPFISVDVGNAVEIVNWTKGGVICPSELSDNGNTVTNPKVLAEHVDELISNQSLLLSLGLQGRKSWEKSFNWDCIAKQYEQLFYKL